MARPGAPSALADWLRDELAAPGWTNRRLAEECGVDQSMVSRWKNGKVVPLARNCDCIAQAFGVEREFVLQLAGHFVAADVEPTDDDWTAKKHEWTRRFERRIHSLNRPEHDDCVERTVTAWLDGFTLLVDRLGT
jgi:transcriptional regulator with XRE-family HTH domain